MNSRNVFLAMTLTAKSQATWVDYTTVPKMGTTEEKGANEAEGEMNLMSVPPLQELKGGDAVPNRSGLSGEPPPAWDYSPRGLGLSVSWARGSLLQQCDEPVRGRGSLRSRAEDDVS